MAPEPGAPSTPSERKQALKAKADRSARKARRAAHKDDDPVDPRSAPLPPSGSESDADEGSPLDSDSSSMTSIPDLEDNENVRKLIDIRKSFQKYVDDVKDNSNPPTTADDASREHYRDWIIRLANYIHELNFIEDFLNKPKPFKHFTRYLPLDNNIRCCILEELQRVISLKVEGPLAKQLQRQKKQGLSAPERLARIHGKFYKAMDSGAGAYQRLHALALNNYKSIDEFEAAIENDIEELRLSGGEVLSDRALARCVRSALDPSEGRAPESTCRSVFQHFMQGSFKMDQIIAHLRRMEANYKEIGTDMCRPSGNALAAAARSTTSSHSALRADQTPTAASTTLTSSPDTICPLPGHGGHKLCDCRVLQRAAKGRKGGKSPKRDAVTNPKACWLCGKEGHIKAECSSLLTAAASTLN